LLRRRSGANLCPRLWLQMDERQGSQQKADDGSNEVSSIKVEKPGQLSAPRLEHFVQRAR
jgi:hypothetical protein